MAFKVSYNITAIDKFSKVIKKIQKNFDHLGKKLSGSGGSLNNINDKTQSLQKNLNKVQAHGKKATESLSKMSSSIKPKSANVFNRSLMNVGNMASVVGSKIKNAFSHFGKGGDMMSKIKGIAGTALVGGAIKSGSDIDADIQRLSVYTHSVKKATKVVDQLRALNIKSGQSVDSLTSSYMNLQEVFGDSKESMRVLRQATDIATLKGTDIKEITDALGTVQAQGKAGLDTFQVLKTHGLNMYDEVAKAYGYNFDTRSGKMATLQLMSSGMISYNQFLDLLNKKMKDLKIKNFAQTFSAKTAGGEMGIIWRQLKDIFKSLGQILGVGLLPFLKHISHSLSGIVWFFRKIADMHSMIASSAVWLGLITAISAKFLFAKSIFGDIGKILRGEISFFGALKKAAQEFVRPFTWLFSKIKWLFGKSKSVAKAVEKPVERFAKNAAPELADIGMKAFGTASLLLQPTTLGDSTLRGRSGTVRGMLAPTIPADINSVQNINKSHVKIEFEPKNADITSVKQVDNSNTTHFDLAGLGFNTYRS